MAVAGDERPVLFIAQVPTRGEPVLQLGLKGLGDDALDSLPHHLVKKFAAF